MELFWKTAAGAVLSLVLILALGKQEKDIGMVLGICVCVMTAVVTLGMLGPVMDFLYRLAETAELGDRSLGILLKAMGVGLVSELVADLCADGGNSSLGKQVRLLGSVMILSLSLPLLETLLELLQTLLGDL